MAASAPPIARCKPITVTLDSSGVAVITPADVDDGSSDDVGIVAYRLDVDTFSEPGEGYTSLEVEDADGQVAQCGAQVIILRDPASLEFCQPRS